MLSWQNGSISSINNLQNYTIHPVWYTYPHLTVFWYCTHTGQKIRIQFLVSLCHSSDPRVCIFSFLVWFFFLGGGGVWRRGGGVKQCPVAEKDCWINWNSAMLCYKLLFHIVVRTFAQFVRPLLATILCIWKIWSGSNNLINITYFTGCQKIKNKIKKCVTAPILEPTYDQKPENFLFALMGYIEIFNFTGHIHG